MQTLLTIGSRKSPLALVQAEWVKSELLKRFPSLEISIKTFETQGDRFLADRLQQLGGKGVFVKELEEALLAKQIDFAVHSMKDMPARLPEGVMVMPFMQRETPEDALISHTGQTLIQLPENAVVGSASLRRKSLLLRARPDLKIEVLRGNVNTRLRKLEEKQFDAIVLAKAGLRRLGLEHKITQTLKADEFIPAANQGILGVEFLETRDDIKQLFESCLDKETQIAFTAETAFLQTLNGGCQTPMGCYTEALGEGRYLLQGFVSGEFAKPFYYQSQVFEAGFAEQSGQVLAQSLLQMGANKIFTTLS